MRSPLIAALGLLAVLALGARGAAAEPTFPPLTAESLAETTVSMPGGFAGEKNLVVLAFVEEQQDEVDTWLTPAADIAARRSDFDFYELPVIGPMNAVMRALIKGGMRSGVKDPAQRARTITIYHDKPKLMAALGLSAADESQIKAILIDKTGAVLWRVDGPATPEAIAALEAKLAE